MKIKGKRIRTIGNELATWQHHLKLASNVNIRIVNIECGDGNENSAGFMSYPLSGGSWTPAGQSSILYDYFLGIGTTLHKLVAKAEWDRSITTC